MRRLERRRYGECLGEVKRIRIGECKRLGGEKRSIREGKERWEEKDGRIREVNERSK